MQPSGAGKVILAGITKQQWSSHNPIERAKRITDYVPIHWVTKYLETSSCEGRDVWWIPERIGVFKGFTS